MFAHTLLAILVLTLFQTAGFADPADLLRPEFAAPSTPPPNPPPNPPQAKPSRPKVSPPKPSRPKTQVNPLAAYMPKVKSALGSGWAEAVTKRIGEFSQGDAVLSFKLDSDGKVTTVAVTSNTSNEPFAEFCARFVRDTKFPPPPRATLSDGLVEIPFTFTIY